MYRLDRSSSTGTNITFSNIPTEYTHLRIMGNVRSDVGSSVDNLYWRINADSATSYMDQYLLGIGTFALAAGSTNSSDKGFQITGGTLPATFRTSVDITIPDYQGPGEKSAVMRWARRNSSAPTAFYVTNHAIWWQSTAPVTRIDMFLAGGGKFIGDPVTLYGLK